MISCKSGVSWARHARHDLVFGVEVGQVGVEVGQVGVEIVQVGVETVVVVVG